MLCNSSLAPSAASKAVVLVAIVFSFLIGAQIYFKGPSISEWRLQTAFPFSQQESKHDSPHPGVAKGAVSIDDTRLPCQRLKGGEDVLVVMRTGATEIKDKLPAHLDTTFKCYDDVVIFSDYEEEFEGHHVYDSLEVVDEVIRNHHPDFALYRRLREHGRNSLAESELSGQVSYESGPIGKNDNEGWRLDKWKFLPMALRTLELRPNKKWYVFVEPDTYIVWSNMLQWLQRLDHTLPLYYGSEVQIGDDIFAHGGSAFVISNSALQRLAKEYLDRKAEWHGFTSQHWAGDCILGRALNQAGVPLSWAWPMFQGSNPATSDWKEDKSDGRNLWCAPAISYHHLSPAEIEATFNFEQAWIRSIQASSQDASSPIPWRQQKRLRLHHRDLFNHYALPNMTTPRGNWTNISDALRADTQDLTLDECRELCERQADCVQYSMSPIGCSFGTEGRLGQPGEMVTSGWVHDRIQQWADGHRKCGSNSDWTVT